MRFCNYCIAGSHFCFVLEKSDKCKHCIQSDHSCDLTISLVKLDYIDEKIYHLCKEKKKAEEMKRELKIKKKQLYK